MRLHALIAAGAALALAAALMIGGKDAAGRLALRAGLPGLAAALLTEPHWQGIAAYRAGDWDRAVARFAQADSPYDLGNAHARAHRYAEALIAYDEALARNPDDTAALRNAELVTELYGGTKIDGVPLRFALENRTGETIAAPEGLGGTRAQGTGDQATNTGTSFDAPQLKTDGLRRISRTFDDKYIAASDRWLTAMPDEPATYLRARLAAERKRRKKLGLAPATEKDAW